MGFVDNADIAGEGGPFIGGEVQAGGIVSPAITDEGRTFEATHARIGPGGLLAVQGFDVGGDTSTVALMEVGLVRPSAPRHDRRGWSIQ